MAEVDGNNAIDTIPIINEGNFNDISIACVRRSRLLIHSTTTEGVRNAVLLCNNGFLFTCGFVVEEIKKKKMISEWMCPF